MQRTLVILKPDATHRRMIGRIIQRFEDKGLRLVAMKMIRVTPELAARHYGEHKGKPFYEPLLAFITSAPVVVMILEAPGAIDMVRRMVGPTFGAEAPAGTIRGDLGISNRYNLVHASDGAASARKEIALFFRDEEICPWTPCDTTWVSELPWDGQ
ncbi:MAG: nucleoside-diphosphate kinase [Planctomycetes bacterium]|nr:nucleoside-diphosphate kinase [Planctomycetota bacterium]